MKTPKESQKEVAETVTCVAPTTRMRNVATSRLRFHQEASVMEGLVPQCDKGAEMLILPHSRSYYKTTL